jgi:hypothetical protein
LTVNSVGSSHRPSGESGESSDVMCDFNTMVSDDTLLATAPSVVSLSSGISRIGFALSLCSLKSARCWSEDSSGSSSQVHKIPRSNWTANFSRHSFLTSEPISLFILHQSYLFLGMHLHCISHYGADPHVHGAQQVSYW